jgi:hypothetical protein
MLFLTEFHLLQVAWKITAINVCVWERERERKKIGGGGGGGEEEKLHTFKTSAHMQSFVHNPLEIAFIVHYI